MKQTDTIPECPDLKNIRQRVREKSASYDRYNFSSHFNDFLKAFFDLAQEYDSLEDFYRICVAVPLEMTGFAGALYLHDEKTDGLYLVCDSGRGVYQDRQPAPADIVLSREPYETDNCYLVPIYSKAPLDVGGTEEGGEPERQTSLRCGPGEICGASRILGMYSVCPLSDLTETDRFFFSKYSNRVGYNLHNRLIAQQNIDHLKFINTLVMDIEHNVIVPNMYFRHLFNQLRKKITELDSLRDDIRHAAGKKGRSCATCLGRCDELSRDLFSYHQELVKHHANISLFLESLFRREHFERGHLVLHPKRCFVEKEIILPQLEHYSSRLRSAGITVERPKNMLDEEFQIPVDIGLLSQVYANLFSNAAKYTREIITLRGQPRKVVAYGRQLIDNFREIGEMGVKFNVFTTGPLLSREEGQRLFQEGVRGIDSTGIPGTGHGLSFIRHVIELHGGTVGYESTSEGNNFYFILPVPPVEYPLPA